MIKTEGLKATVSVCTSCNVVTLSTTSVNFNSSVHGDSNGDARLVSKKRKNDTIILSVVRMTFVHRLTFNAKIEDTFTSCRVCIDQNSSVLPTDSCPTNPARQLGQLHFVQSIQSVEATNCLCTNTAKSRDTCVSIRSVIALSWALQVIFKVRSVSVHSVTRCTWLASLLRFSLSSRNGPFIVRSTRLFYRPSGFTKLLHPSRGSQPIQTSVCSCFCSASPTSSRFNSYCVVPWHICGGVWDPWPIEYQSCKLATLL